MLTTLPPPFQFAPGWAEARASSCCMFQSVHMRMIAANALTATNVLTAAILPTPISQPFIAAPAFPVPPQPRQHQRDPLVQAYHLLRPAPSSPSPLRRP